LENVKLSAKMPIVVENLKYMYIRKLQTVGNLARTFTTQIKICYATTCAYKFRKGGVII